MSSLDLEKLEMKKKKLFFSFCQLKKNNFAHFGDLKNIWPGGIKCAANLPSHDRKKLFSFLFKYKLLWLRKKIISVSRFHFVKH